MDTQKETRPAGNLWDCCFRLRKYDFRFPDRKQIAQLWRQGLVAMETTSSHHRQTQSRKLKAIFASFFFFVQFYFLAPKEPKSPPNAHTHYHEVILLFLFSLQQEKKICYHKDNNIGLHVANNLTFSDTYLHNFKRLYGIYFTAYLCIGI